MRLILFMMFAQAAYCCDCDTPSVAQARKHADAVFRGTIVAFHDSEPSGDSARTWRVAVFRVTRVWKGEVHSTFEMPALEEGTACVGFWPDHLKVGADLLVYAWRVDRDYVTDICARTSRASKSKDFSKLGPGHAPKDAK